MNGYLFSKLKINDKKELERYIEYIDQSKVVFIPEKPNKYIVNNEGLLIDKVEVINGFGIILKYNNNIVTILRGTNLYIDYIEGSNVISIVYEYYDEYSLKNKTLYLQYDRDGLSDFSIIYTGKYNIGEYVIPKNIDYNFKENKKNNKDSFTSPLFNFLINQIGKNKDKTIEQFKNLLEQNFNDNDFETSSKIMQFKIIDILDNLYVIQSDFKKNNTLEFTEQIYYIEEKDLITFEEIKNDSLDLFRKIIERH